MGPIQTSGVGIPKFKVVVTCDMHLSKGQISRPQGGSNDHPLLPHPLSPLPLPPPSTQYLYIPINLAYPIKQSKHVVAMVKTSTSPFYLPPELDLKDSSSSGPVKVQMWLGLHFRNRIRMSVDWYYLSPHIGLTWSIVGESVESRGSILRMLELFLLLGTKVGGGVWYGVVETGGCYYR